MKLKKDKAAVFIKHCSCHNGKYFCSVARVSNLLGEHEVCVASDGGAVGDEVGH